jgi:nitrite reductase/ring-hydroxylating ferredoxin subunit
LPHLISIIRSGEAREICSFNVAEKCYVIGNVCTPLRGPLNEGRLERYEVESSWHGSKFDVRTGEPTKTPSRQEVPVYELKLEDNNILIGKG